MTSLIDLFVKAYEGTLQGNQVGIIALGPITDDQFDVKQDLTYTVYVDFKTAIEHIFADINRALAMQKPNPDGTHDIKYEYEPTTLSGWFEHGSHRTSFTYIGVGFKGLSFKNIQPQQN